VLGLVLLPVLGLALFQAVKRDKPPSLHGMVMAEAIWREQEEMNPDNTVSDSTHLLDGTCGPDSSLPDAEPPHLFSCLLRSQIKATMAVDEELWEVEIDDRGCWSAEHTKSRYADSREWSYAGGTRYMACDPDALTTISG